MATVFFKTTPTQDEEIKKMMDAEGYTSKAEFFRFLLKFFKYHKTREELDFEKSAHELGEIFKVLKKQGKINKSIEDQLKDV